MFKALSSFIFFFWLLSSLVLSCVAGVKDHSFHMEKVSHYVFCPVGPLSTPPLSLSRCLGPPQMASISFTALLKKNKVRMSIKMKLRTNQGLLVIFLGPPPSVSFPKTVPPLSVGALIGQLSTIIRGLGRTSPQFSGSISRTGSFFPFTC